MRLPLLPRAAIAVAAVTVYGCGTSSSPSMPGSAQDSGSSVADAGQEAEAGAACGPATASPGKVQCGAITCATPAEVCCYDQAPPRCTAGASCNGSSIACDESTDCAPSGSYCCSGASAISPDAGFAQVTVGTFCSTSPMTCLPQPGVGNSSTLACQVDSECAGTGSTCLAHTCSFGQCVHLCGPAGVSDCN